jgi:hypothetical protein
MQDLGKLFAYCRFKKRVPNEKLDYKQNLIKTIGHSKDLAFLIEETKFNKIKI